MDELDSIFIAQHCSSAQQISSLLKQRNPIKETDKNTYKTALLIEQMIEEGKRVQNKANLQFIITMVVCRLGFNPTKKNEEYKTKLKTVA